MKVEIIEYREDYIMPQRGHDIDVGLDAPVPQDGILYPGPNIIALGYGLKVPVGYNVALHPRTGMVSGAKTLDFKVANMKNTTVGEVVPNGICIDAKHPPIDPGYTGEIHAIVINHSNIAIEYPRGTRFGQLVCNAITYLEPVKATDTSRGAGAFGSTGAVTKA